MQSLRTTGEHVKLAWRSWRKRPGLFTVALLTIALGVGANSAVFTAVNGVLLSALPFDNPDRAVIIWSSNPPLARQFGFPDKLAASPGLFADWQRDSTLLAQLAGFAPQPRTLTGPGEPEALAAVGVTGAFFDALGAHALIGRTLTPDDDRPGAPRVAVLSHALWQRRFDSSPDILGRAITLDGSPTTIVGVMPARVRFPRAAEMPPGSDFGETPDLWLPFAWSEEARALRWDHYVYGIGRLKPGVAVRQADAELVTISAHAQAHFPGTDQNWSARVEPLRDQLVGELRAPLHLLAGAAALVLLIACANVANLLLIAGAARQREMAIRTALGAAPSRLVAQGLTESVLLALAGGALGCLLAAWSVRLLRLAVPAALAPLRDVGVDWRFVAFSCLLSLVAGVAFGLLPTLLTARADLREPLQDASRGSSSGTRGTRTRRALIVAETALAVVLLIGAGLLIRSFAALLRVDPGFRSEHVLSLTLPLDGARAQDAARRRTVVDMLLTRVRAMPGVTMAGAIDDLPMSAEMNVSVITIDGQPRPAPGHATMVGDRTITPGYAETVDIPLRKGRLLTAADRADSPLVAVIDEAMARAWWPGVDAVGRRFKMGPFDTPNPWITVVGILGSVRHSGLDTTPRPMMYRPYAQTSSAEMTVLIRTTTDPAALTASVRAALHAIDPYQPVAKVRTLQTVVDESVAPRRFMMLLLGAFAGLALVLACVGLYAVIAQTVTRRTREIGVRLALGASPARVLRQVLLEGVALTSIGIAIGLAGAAAATSILSSMLYGVARFDPVTFLGVPLLLLAVALAACGVPGRRAMRVDPTTALRAD